MNHPLKWLVLASLTNLVGNVLGTTLALQHNLTAGFGGFIHGQDVFHDFISTGTALSAPLTYMLIQLGERIILRLLSPNGFDLAQFIVYMVNVVSAIAMFVFGIWAWRTMRASAPHTG